MKINKNLRLWLLMEFFLIIFIIAVGVITYKLENDVITPAILFVFMTVGNCGAYIERIDHEI